MIISLESLDSGFRRNDGCHWRLLISGERTQVANLRYRMSMGSQTKEIGVSTDLDNSISANNCLHLHWAYDHFCRDKASGALAWTWSMPSVVTWERVVKWVLSPLTPLRLPPP